MVEVVGIFLAEVVVVLVQLQMVSLVDLRSVVKHLLFVSYLLISHVHSILTFWLLHRLVDPAVHDVVAIVADRAISSLGKLCMDKLRHLGNL